MWKNEMRMTRRFFNRATLLGMPAVISVSHAQRRGPTVVTSACPLGDFASQLGDHYAKPVTFEGPVLLWHGYMQKVVPRPLPDGREIFSWVRHSFVIPEDAGIFEAPALSVGFISKAVEAYHQSNPEFPRYRVFESSMGFHIVPTDARDEAGVLRPVKSLLDTSILVPIGERIASEHVQAVLEAVSRAAEIPTTLEDWYFDSAYAANGYMYRGEATGAERPYMLFKWGASDVSARDALIDLLKASATTMSWTFGCFPDYNHGNRPKCTLALQALVVNGRAVWYDRCTNCRLIPTQAK
jgi:hypothetical protein